MGTARSAYLYAKNKVITDNFMSLSQNKTTFDSHSLFFEEKLRENVLTTESALYCSSSVSM